MLIPSIDLMGGRVVQLEQGERLAFESRDLDGWITRFSNFPMVQVIDLDAALGRGGNADLVRDVCARLPCQVGGGLRTVAAARTAFDAGARRVIVGSAFFTATGVDLTAAARFADALDPARLVAAVDSRNRHVVIHGWKTSLPVTPEDAARALAPFVGTFLYTHVDTEGLLTGLDRAAVRSMRTATDRHLIAAGGIRRSDEVAWLESIRVDAVVGMALYTGLMPTDDVGDPPPIGRSRPAR